MCHGMLLLLFTVVCRCVCLSVAVPLPQVWDPESGQCLQSIPSAHGGAVTGLAQWNEYLLSCAIDGTVTVRPPPASPWFQVLGNLNLAFVLPGALLHAPCCQGKESKYQRAWVVGASSCVLVKAAGLRRLVVAWGCQRPRECQLCPVVCVCRCGASTRSQDSWSQSSDTPRRRTGVRRGHAWGGCSIRPGASLLSQPWGGFHLA